jgi:hypothetical protein
VARCIEIRLKMFGFIDGPQVGVNAVVVNWDALAGVYPEQRFVGASGDCE